MRIFYTLFKSQFGKGERGAEVCGKEFCFFAAGGGGGVFVWEEEFFLGGGRRWAGKRIFLFLFFGREIEVHGKEGFFQCSFFSFYSYTFLLFNVGDIKNICEINNIFPTPLLCHLYPLILIPSYQIEFPFFFISRSVDRDNHCLSFSNSIYLLSFSFFPAAQSLFHLPQFSLHSYNLSSILSLK